MAKAKRETRVRARSRTAVVLALLVAGGACARSDDASDVVARVGDYRLTVDAVYTLLVDQEELPIDASVVRSVADLWIDYTLLADHAARDSSFASMDFSGVIRPLIEQSMVMQLRDSVVQVDTAISEAELEGLYAGEAPDVEIHARHILLGYPQQATQQQRDSVRARLEEIRTRILSGASFEQMAAQYSQDPGTARVGGDLGTFGRGDMVAPFEEAALALEPGEVSDVVETPLGLHLIRIDERHVRSFEEAAADFRLDVQDRRNTAAESTFIAGLEGRSTPVLIDGALGVARELARTPETRLSGSAARRALLQWEGGAYTAGELLDVLRADPGALRDEILRRSDQELTNFLRGQARRKLLVEEARLRGLEPGRLALDSLTLAARGELRAATRTLGLLDLDRAPGEELSRAVSRAARDALVDNLSGATRIVPLGLVGYQLREGVSVAVFDAGIGRVLLRIAEARTARAPSTLEESLAPSQQPADTAAR